MADQRQILTDKNIARLPLAKEKQYKVRDSELPSSADICRWCSPTSSKALHSTVNEFTGGAQIRHFVMAVTVAASRRDVPSCARRWLLATT
jgi:hypothetical protein